LYSLSIFPDAVFSRTMKRRSLTHFQSQLPSRYPIRQILKTFLELLPWEGSLLQPQEESESVVPNMVGTVVTSMHKSGFKHPQGLFLLFSLLVFLVQLLTVRLQFRFFLL